MTPMVSEDIPEAPGPNASMQFGEATENARLQREVESRTGTGQNTPRARGGSLLSSPQPTHITPPNSATQSPPDFPPDNGIPRTADGRLDLSKIFPDVSTVNSWRLNAKTWANAPGAGKYLKFLAKHSQADVGRT